MCVLVNIFCVYGKLPCCKERNVPTLIMCHGVCDSKRVNQSSTYLCLLFHTFIPSVAYVHMIISRCKQDGQVDILRSRSIMESRLMRQTVL